VALAAGFSDVGGVILRSYDKGKSWATVETPDHGLWSITSRYLSNQRYIIASDEFGYYYRSSNSGSSWEQLIPTINATNSQYVLYGTSIGTNGYAFISGINYVAYTMSISATAPIWIESIPDSTLTYFDIR
jgi:photosystem II stability/assembly factor-like uncharacterized protein